MEVQENQKENMWIVDSHPCCTPVIDSHQSCAPILKESPQSTSPHGTLSPKREECEVSLIFFGSLHFYGCFLNVHITFYHPYPILSFGEKSFKFCNEKVNGIFV